MKKLFLLILFTVTVFIVNGQNNVGIGTSSPRASAMLEVKSNNQGLLIPRVDITTLQPSLVALDHGLVVYDTVVGATFVWNGTTFINLSTGITTLQTAYNAVQSINMNSGNIDFISSAANSVLYIDEANERIGIGTNTPNAQLDVSQEIVVNGIEIGRGLNNDNRSTGVGLRTLDVTNLAAANTVFGYEAGWQITDGTDNVAVGAQALTQNTTGSTNTAIGGFALLNNFIGSNNTAIGALADVSVDGLNNATAIGANAIVDASNRMVLGATGTAIQFNGELRPNNLPGTAGQVLTSQGPGATPTWANAGGSGWGLTGNAGINPATNFLGTTDAQPLRFATGAGGVERMRILATGNVGIGTVTPGAKLNIHEPNIAATAPTVLTLTGASTGGGSIGMEFSSTNGSAETNTAAITLKNFTANDKSLQFLNANPNAISTTRIFRFLDNTTAPVLTMLNSGNVGIGTENPINLLHVTGDAARFDSVIISNNAQAGYVLTAADASGAASWQPAAGGVSGTGATNKLAYWTGANTLSFNTGLHYESGNQRLGLGTAAPAEFLHVNSGNPITVASRFTNSTTGFTGSDGFGFGITGTGNAFINNDEATPINISTASVTRMTIDATGNVGIGNSAPSAKLDIQSTGNLLINAEGNSPIGSWLNLYNNSAGGRQYGLISSANGNGEGGGLFMFYDHTAGFPRMIINSIGNVGIGTTAPAFPLDVVGQARISDNILFGNSGGAATGDFRIDGFQNELSLHAENFNAANVSTSIGFHTASPFSASTRKMIITGSGDVGIGTNTPSYKLDVVGDNGVRIAPAAGGENFLTLVNATTGAPSWGINDYTNRDLAFYRYDGVGGFLNTSLLIQNSTGNVGIGSDNISLNPTTALYVAENNGNGPVATFRNTYPGGPIAPEGIRIRLDDNDLAANRYISFYQSGAEIGSVQGFNGSVAYATTSDRRLKTNIKDFDGALDLVKAIRPREYTYKVDLDRMEYGFIAQELQLVLPHLVSGTPDGDVITNPMMVDYSRITPVLTKAIQEQQVLIENQEERIAELERQLGKTSEENTSPKASSTVSKSTTETELLQAQLNEMKAQIERLNSILTSEAKK